MLAFSYRCALVFVLLISFASCVRAQSTKETIEKLQQQLNALNKQLAAEEDSPEAEEARYTSKITQISPSRVVPPPRQEEIIVTRLYDLSDLFAIVPAYPARFQSDLGGAGQLIFPQAFGGEAATGGSGSGAMGGMGGGGGFFNIFPTAESIVEPSQKTLRQMGGDGSSGGGTLDGAKTSVGSLIRAIQSTVSPDEWESAGGSSTIAQLGMALLITTNQETHDQIAALLGQFRKRWGTLRTVSLQAYWLWLDEAELSALLATADEKPKPGSRPFAYGSVKQDKWNEVLAAADARAAEEAEEQTGEAGGYRAAVTCYNGQTVHTLAGQQKLVVTDLQPQWLGPDRVDKEQQTLGGVGYVPRTALVQEGMALQVTPLTNTSGKYVVLDLQSRLAKLAEQTQPALKKEGVEDERGMDNEATPGPRTVLEALPLPALEISRLSTTLRVPVGEPYLVGGMSQAGRRMGKHRLYLFVELHVQELRDDVEPAAQLGSADEKQTPAEK